MFLISFFIYSIYCASWNVNAKKPPDLAAWLVHPTKNPDLYAIGIQEIVDLNAGNLLLDSKSPSAMWEEKIQKTLRGKYTKIHSRHLVGISLCIFIKTALVVHIILKTTKTHP